MQEVTPVEGLLPTCGVCGVGSGVSVVLEWDKDELCLLLRPEGGGGGGGGGVKVDFPVFTYLIRAAEDEQEEKNRTEI